MLSLHHQKHRSPLHHIFITTTTSTHTNHIPDKFSLTYKFNVHDSQDYSLKLNCQYENTFSTSMPFTARIIQHNNGQRIDFTNQQKKQQAKTNKHQSDTSTTLESFQSLDLRLSATNIRLHN